MQSPNLLKYSNGWGHLIMSVALLATGVILLLMHDTAATPVGISLILTVAGYWFVSSSANAQQQAHAATIQVNTPAPAVSVLPAPSTPVGIPMPTATGGQSETHQ